MISVAAIRMQQFGVQFYQASLTARDIDNLVRFEVLSYGETTHPPVRGGKRRGSAPKVNWDLLERRIAASEKAYQRQIIRRKIDELVQYYEQCRLARDLPSIPGAVIISSDEMLRFEPVDDSNLGVLKVPEREGVLRAIDGQHRLLALHADIDRFGEEDFTVPAVLDVEIDTWLAAKKLGQPTDGFIVPVPKRFARQNAALDRFLRAAPTNHYHMDFGFLDHPM